MRRLSCGGALVTIAVAAAVGFGPACASFDAESGVDGGVPPDGASGSDGAGGSDAPFEPDAAVAPTEAGTSSYAVTVLADGPKAYWRLDESPGSSVVRSLGGMSDGKVLGGPSLGQPGALTNDPDTSISFGASQLLQANDAFDFVGVAPFSLEAWVKPTIIDDQFHMLFSKYGMSKAVTRESYAVYLHQATPADPQEMVFERYVDDVRLAAVAVAPAVSAGVWHHAVATYDGVVLTLYVDGRSLGSAQDTRSQQSKVGPLYVGADGPTKFSLLGSIDEVAIYDKALPAPAVARHFRVGSTGLP